MLDRLIGLAGPKPETAAQVPAAGEAWVERERAVDQPDHGADVLAEKRQHEGGVGEDARVVLPRLERLPSKTAGLAAGWVWVFGTTRSDQLQVANRRPGKSRSVMPSDRDRLLEQVQRLENPRLCYWIKGRKRAQV